MPQLCSEMDSTSDEEVLISGNVFISCDNHYNNHVLWLRCIHPNEMALLQGLEASVLTSCWPYSPHVLSDL